MGKVSVVIPTHNRAVEVQETIDSVLQQTELPLEILVVDDGSTDGTAEQLKKYGNRIKYVYQPNSGAAAARNAGIAASSGDVIAFLDSDCVAEKQWLSALCNELKADEAGVVTGSMVFFKADTLIEKYCKIYDKNIAGGSVNHPFLPFPNTGNMAVKRQVFESVGAFDTAFPWCEDNEFGWRLGSASAYKIRFAADAIVYHKHRSSLQGLLKQKRNYGYGKVLLYRKFPGYRKSFLRDSAELIGETLQLLIRTAARCIKVFFQGNDKLLYVGEHLISILCIWSRFRGMVQARQEHNIW